MTTHKWGWREPDPADDGPEVEIISFFRVYPDGAFTSLGPITPMQWWFLLAIVRGSPAKP